MRPHLFFFLILFSSFSAYSFTYEDLISLITTQHLNSIEQVLPKLPEKMRSNFTLVYESQSLQLATPEAPRVIMFGKDAKFVCSFSGAENLAGFDTMECYQFRDRTKTFEFHEIEFPSVRNNLSGVAFSKKNHQATGPMSCTACHGKDPRPNWEEYFTWPGTYGSHDDSFGIDSRNVSYKNADVQEVQKELQNFLSFKALAYTSPRYRNLIFADLNFSPYSMDYKSDDDNKRPNLRFVEDITPLVAERNTRILRSLPKSVQRSYLKAVIGCGSNDYGPILGKYIFERDWTPAFRVSENTCAQNQICPTPRGPYTYTDGTTFLNWEVAIRLAAKARTRKSLDENFLKGVDYVLKGNGPEQNPFLKCKFYSEPGR